MECTQNPFDCIGIYYFERNGKKGYSRVLDFVYFYPKTQRRGYYYPGEGVKRVGKLVKYDQLKKLNSSGAFFFLFIRPQGLCGGVLAPSLDRKKRISGLVCK